MTVEIAPFLTAPLFPGITFIVFFMLNLHLGTKIIWCSAFRNHVFSARPVVRDFCTFCVPRSSIAVRENPVKLPVKPTIFHVNYQNNSSRCPQGFCIFSVALCHVVLYTRNCSSSCLPCRNICSIISSVLFLLLSSRLLNSRAPRCCSH